MSRLKSLYGFLLVLFSPYLLLASCGSSSCPIDTYTHDAIEKGMIHLDISYEYIDQNQPRIGRESAVVGEITGHHDEVYTLNEIRRLNLEAGISNRLSILTTLPFIHREHQHIHHHHGSDITESWNFNGLGDLSILMRYKLLKSQSGGAVSVLAGGIIPTGRDEVLNAEGETAEPGLLPGKSALSLIIGGSITGSRTARTWNGVHARIPFFVSSTYQWNGKGIEDYRIGNIWQLNTGTVLPVLPRIGLLAQLNIRIHRKDDKGDTGEEVQKTGSTLIYASPGVQLMLADQLWTYMYVQLPVYQRVNVIQLTSDYNFIAGLSYRFNALKNYDEK